MLIYYQSKLSHSGITGYKVFEGITRKSNRSSLSNLLHNKVNNREEVDKYVKWYRSVKTDKIKKMLIEIASNQLFEGEYQELLRIILNKRILNENQSRQLKRYAGKLCYYSKVRNFTSKKSGNYKFKVAFLTLTTPITTSQDQFLKAFELFLDYLRRTAKCTYVWKKELGEKNGNLHVHILINNFIPYYIIEWKWKKLLIAQGVNWPKNENGKDTTSHYRIELPRNRRLVAHYISKYMSKAYDMPKEVGYIWGKSEILEQCKDHVFIENELPTEEINTLKSLCRTIQDCFITHICVNLLNVKTVAPTIYKEFQEQFKEFTQLISQEQKYWYI